MLSQNLYPELSKDSILVEIDVLRVRFSRAIGIPILSTSCLSAKVSGDVPSKGIDVLSQDLLLALQSDSRLRPQDLWFSSEDVELAVSQGSVCRKDIVWLGVVNIILMAIVSCTSAWLAASVFRKSRLSRVEQRRTSGGECTECGYAIDAQSSICPECGARVMRKRDPRETCL